MNRFVAAVGLLVLMAVPAVFVSVLADVRRRDDSIPGPLISNRIRERMEQRRLERVPRLGSATRLPGGGPGFESIQIKGQIRTFVRYTPNSVLVAGKRAPVVIALHGAAMTASQFQAMLGLNAVADRERFIVVYPQGLQNIWNDGRPLDDKAVKIETEADDLTFLNALGDALVADGVADPHRLFLAGVSNGGFMALRLACEPESQFAAFGAVIASLPTAASAKCAPNHPAPIVMINGTDDEMIRFDGAENQFGVKGNLAVPEAVKFFADLNKCASSTDVRLDPRDVSDRTRVTKSVWTDCAEGGSVVSYTVSGGGHRVPRISPPEATQTVTVPAVAKDPSHLPVSVVEAAIDAANSNSGGVVSRQLDTAEALWSFFKPFQR